MTGRQTAHGIALVVGCLAVAGACRWSSPPADRASASGPTLELVFTYGSEKQPWIEETTAAFNRQQHRTASGKTILVDAVPMGSGEAIEELLAGTRKALANSLCRQHPGIQVARWATGSGSVVHRVNVIWTNLEGLHAHLSGESRHQT